MRSLSPICLLWVVSICAGQSATIDTPAGVLSIDSPLGFSDLPELPADTNHLAELRISGAATFTPLVDGWQFRNLATDDGASVCIFWTGARAFAMTWVCTPASGAPFQFVVNVGGDNPDPPGPDPPGPQPDLNERAQFIYDKAIMVGLPAEARAFANAYGGTAAQIGAGTITSLTAARDNLTAAIREAGQQFGGWSAKWKPLNTAILLAFKKDAQTLPAAKQLMQDCADGLAAAGLSSKVIHAGP